MGKHHLMGAFLVTQSVLGTMLIAGEMCRLHKIDGVRITQLYRLTWVTDSEIKLPEGTTVVMQSDLWHSPGHRSPLHQFLFELEQMFLEKHPILISELSAMENPPRPLVNCSSG